MNDRFTARRLGLRRHRWFRFAVAGLVLVLALVVVWLVWFSSVLSARSVEVEGLTSLSAKQVDEVAEVPLDGPLARIDLTGITARVKKMPRVQEVEVSRSWPHTVSIEITERTAVTWMSVDGEFRGVDRFGVEFRTYDEKPTKLIEARVTADEPAQRLQTLEAVARVADRIRRDDPALNKQLRLITAGSKDSVQLGLTEGRTVTWGSVAEPARKLEVLDTLLGIEASQYDVSAPDQPTTRE
ncbi:cell division protein FtsQ/DivIB [Aeromicrobium sp. CF3.5]|uniref:cell division protein FtsQ/DivIB n=1 Tax=Aeromicrobium sp. CF3.5 TaxID=3373078 RepID=UPI003EE7D641